MSPRKTNCYIALKTAKAPPRGYAERGSLAVVLGFGLLEAGGDSGLCRKPIECGRTWKRDAPVPGRKGTVGAQCERYDCPLHWTPAVIAASAAAAAAAIAAVTTGSARMIDLNCPRINSVPA